MSATYTNKHRKLEKYVEVVREDGLNTDQNVNIGVTGTPNLWVAGNLSVGGTMSGYKGSVVDTTASTTLTATQTGATILLDAAAGLTITLPAPSAGLTFTFVVSTSVTSNAYKIITNAGTVFLLGELNVPTATGTGKWFFGDGTTMVSVNLNGTTTGGLKGGHFTVTCISATAWEVVGIVEGSGTVATPFATT